MQDQKDTDQKNGDREHNRNTTPDSANDRKPEKSEQDQNSRSSQSTR